MLSNQITFFALYHHSSSVPVYPIQMQVGGILISDDALIFSFECRYQPDQINVLLPEPTTPAARDFLWQHTCCEAFVALPDGKNYLEFNFSPSGCWAVYRFTDYRVRDESYVCAEASTVQCEPRADGFDLTATISPKILPQKSADESWQIGLTAVIETTDGQKSYWAMRHDAPQPDFHLRSQFLLALP